MIRSRDRGVKGGVRVEEFDQGQGQRLGEGGLEEFNQGQSQR